MKIEYQEREREEDFVFDEGEKPNSKACNPYKIQQSNQRKRLPIPNPRIVNIEHVSGLWNGKLLTETRPSLSPKSLG